MNNSQHKWSLYIEKIRHYVNTMKTKTIYILLLLMFVSLATAADKSEKKANKLLDKVRKDLVSLSADFEQYEIDANQNVSEKSSGKVWLKSPNQFKWEYQKPVPQLIMANGKKVWVYDADLEQVTVKQQRSKQNPIYVLLNKKLTEDNYTVRLEPQQNDKKQAIKWVSMTPKIPSDEIKIVWLGIKDKELTVLKLQNQMDNIVIFEFKNMKRNPQLLEGYFSFNIPEGTDVIQDTPQIGEF